MFVDAITCWKSLLIITRYKISRGNTENLDQKKAFWRQNFSVYGELLVALSSNYDSTRFHTCNKVNKELIFTSYHVIRFIGLTEPIFVPKQVVVNALDAPRSESGHEPAESAERWPAHLRRSFYLSRTFMRAGLNT